MSRRPNYGIDSPVIIAAQAALSVVALTAAALPHFLGPALGWIALIVGLYSAQAALGMVYYSKRGKLKLRDQLLDLIPWRGDEMVLDVGCGRGLLLIGAARRLTSGKAIGVDIWLPRAVAGNSAAAVLENAALASVSDRVEVREGDVRQLPFDDAVFDVVVSNFVWHELSAAAEREKMACEMARVLKPGGRLALVDFIFTGHCVEALRNNGMIDARRERVGSRIGFLIAAILHLGALQVYCVTARKDSRSAG